MANNQTSTDLQVAVLPVIATPAHLDCSMATMLVAVLLAQLAHHIDMLDTHAVLQVAGTFEHVPVTPLTRRLLLVLPVALANLAYRV